MIPQPKINDQKYGSAAKNLNLFQCIQGTARLNIKKHFEIKSRGRKALHGDTQKVTRLVFILR